MSGYQTVSTQFTATGFAACPSGDVVLGGGYELTGPTTTQVTESVPANSGGFAGWLVSFNSAVDGVVYATCAAAG